MSLSGTHQDALALTQMSCGFMPHSPHQKVVWVIGSNATLWSFTLIVPSTHDLITQRRMLMSGVNRVYEEPPLCDLVVSQLVGRRSCSCWVWVWDQNWSTLILNQRMTTECLFSRRDLINSFYKRKLESSLCSEPQSRRSPVQIQYLSLFCSIRSMKWSQETTCPVWRQDSEAPPPPPLISPRLAAHDTTEIPQSLSAHTWSDGTRTGAKGRDVAESSMEHHGVHQDSDFSQVFCSVCFWAENLTNMCEHLQIAERLRCCNVL